MKLHPSAKIYLDESHIPNAGRGVFACQKIKKGELIERSPVIVLTAEQVPKIRHTELHNYYFMWGGDDSEHEGAIALGFGSLYNHSYSPNATYKKVLEEGVIDFIALKDIDPGEEITTNYNHGDPEDKSKLFIDGVPSAR